MVDRLGLDDLADVVVVLRAVGAELHGDQVVDLGDADESVAEFAAHGSADDGGGVFVFPQVDGDAGVVVELPGAGWIETVTLHRVGVGVEDIGVVGVGDEVDVFGVAGPAVHHRGQPADQGVADAQFAEQRHRVVHGGGEVGHVVGGAGAGAGLRHRGRGFSATLRPGQGIGKGTHRTASVLLPR